MAAHHWPARLGELSRCSRRDLGQTTLTKGFVGMQRIFSNGRQQSLLLSGCGCMQSVASASSHRLHATRRLKQEFFLGRSNIPFGARLFFWWLLALWREDWLFFSESRVASHSIFVVGENGICRGQSGPSPSTVNSPDATGRHSDGH